MKIRVGPQSTVLAVLLGLVGCTSGDAVPENRAGASDATGEQADVSFYVLVKSSNWAQATDGSLTLLNYHFFSEIFLEEGGSVTSASLSGPGLADQGARFEDRGSNWYFEGGHFDTVEEADAAYPNGSFSFDLSTPSVQLQDLELSLAGPDGQTDIPAPITIHLSQGGAPVSPVAVDAEQDLVVGWSEYSNGATDPRGIVDDMIFVVLADCHGERIFHTGLPFQGDYTTFETTEVRVPAERLRPGHPYSAFVEFPHVADSRTDQGVPGFTSFATASYLDVRTTGQGGDEGCPEVAPPMDTGQTDRMDSR